MLLISKYDVLNEKMMDVVGVGPGMVIGEIGAGGGDFPVPT